MAWGHLGYFTSKHKPTHTHTHTYIASILESPSMTHFLFVGISPTDSHSPPKKKEKGKKTNPPSICWPFGFWGVCLFLLCQGALFAALCDTNIEPLVVKDSFLRGWPFFLPIFAQKVAASHIVSQQVAIFPPSFLTKGGKKKDTPALFGGGVGSLR